MFIQLTKDFRGIHIGETGAQWIRNLLFQYITDPLRVTGIL